MNPQAFGRDGLLAHLSPPGDPRRRGPYRRCGTRVPGAGQRRGVAAGTAALLRGRAACPVRGLRPGLAHSTHAHDLRRLHTAVWQGLCQLHPPGGASPPSRGRMASLRPAFEVQLALLL